MTPSPIESITPALSLRNVRVTYPGRRKQAAIEALRGIDLTIETGQAVAMLGPNGSGKSTLMRVICGLLRPARDRGSVRVFGESEPTAVRRAMGVVFQHTAIDPHQRVREALLYQAILYGIPRSEADDRIDHDLEQAGLADRRDQLIKTLSLGLARRVDLVRSLLHRPRLLLLDEPTVGLDPTAREGFLRLIEDRRAAQSLTVLLSTHLVDEAERQDRVLLLHEGRLVADDTPTALRRQLGSFIVTVHDPDWSPLEPDRDVWEKRHGAWIRPLIDDHDVAGRLASELAQLGVPFTIAPPTLADVFEHLTGSSLARSSSLQHEGTAA